MSVAYYDPPSKRRFTILENKMTDEDLDGIRKACDYSLDGEWKHKVFSIHKNFGFLKKAINILLVNGYDVQEDGFFDPEKGKLDCIFEYHIYRSKKDVKIDFTFDLHADNDNDTPVHTLIYYPILTFPRGGELVVYRKENIPEVINPRHEKMVCFSGDLMHTMAPCCGTGIRESIVLQIPAKREII